MVAVISFAALTGQAADSKDGHKRVGVDEFFELWTKEKHTVLDVRTPAEFAEGHIPGAKNIDFYAKDFAERLGKLDKSKPYLMHCRSGGRSGKAGAMMSKMGFKLVYDLAPGMNGWRKAKKPIEK